MRGQRNFKASVIIRMLTAVANGQYFSAVYWHCVMMNIPIKDVATAIMCQVSITSACYSFAQS